MIHARLCWMDLVEVERLRGASRFRGRQMVDLDQLQLLGYFCAEVKSSECPWMSLFSNTL